MKHGLIERRLIARENVSDRAVLGFVGGQLLSLRAAEKEGVERDSHLYIDRGYLAEFFGYSGVSPLVLSMKRHHNAGCYMRDPSVLVDDDDERRPDTEQYNVRLDLAFDRQSSLIFVVFFAWGDISQGQELFCNLNLGDWYSRDHRKLFFLARRNHWFHRNAALLEQTLIAKTGIDLVNILDREAARQTAGTELLSASTATANGAGAGRLADLAEEWRWMGDVADRSRAIEQAKNDGLVKIELWRAFEGSRAAYIRKVFCGSSVRPETRKIWQDMGTCIPPTVQVKIDKQLIHMPVDKEKLIALLDLVRFHANHTGSQQPAASLGSQSQIDGDGSGRSLLIA